MKRSFCLILLSMLILSASAEANTGKSPALSASSEIGRYQLFQGNYTSIDLKRKESNPHQAVFVIDTVTGEVKRYINRIDEDGRYVETWLPTNLPLPEKKK